ncbi:MAG: TSUP family transporter [Acidobacteria bacterium]|nr:TSUP family transporter [Acidobacteriota bacterium]
MAWLGALAIGLSLGLLGSGGSILTVPVLIFLVGESEKVAIAESLAIVGGIALVGAMPFVIRRLVAWRSVVFFGVPGMIGSYAGAAMSRYVSGAFQLALFGGIMLLAAALMWRPPDFASAKRESVRQLWKIAMDGFFVGALTGFVGVGGGFMIVPALVLLGGLPMRLAVGTSLLIIAMKSLTGFVKYLDVLAELGLGADWTLIFVLTAIGAVGTLLGNWLGARLPQQRLREAFAVFLVAMAGFVLYTSL